MKNTFCSFSNLRLKSHQFYCVIMSSTLSVELILILQEFFLSLLSLQFSIGRRFQLNGWTDWLQIFTECTSNRWPVHGGKDFDDDSLFGLATRGRHVKNKYRNCDYTYISHRATREIILTAIWCLVCPAGCATWKYKNCNHTSMIKRKSTKFLWWFPLLMVRNILVRFSHLDTFSYL